MLQYLARNTHRTAVGNERLVDIDERGVRLRVRVDANPGQPTGKRTVVIDGCDFIARLLQHVLPTGFKRIRHYGLLAAPLKRQRLHTARALLAMPQPNPIANEDVRAFMRRVAAIEIQLCGHCQRGHWQVIGQCQANRQPLLALLPARTRGPP